MRELQGARYDAVKVDWGEAALLAATAIPAARNSRIDELLPYCWQPGDWFPKVRIAVVQLLASYHCIEHGDNGIVIGPPGRGQDARGGEVVGLKAVEAGHP